MNDVLHSLQLLSILALPVLFAITLHEAAHGWMANRLGDPTACQLGRISINPIRHLDPVGTLLVPALTFVLAGFLFGWARPVPVDWRRLRHPRRDMGLVAIAGPGANLLMALLWGGLIHLALWLLPLSAWLAQPLLHMAAAGVLINVVLMVLNLFPLLPLDGGRLLQTLLPPRAARQYARLEPFGLYLLLALLLTGLLGTLLQPPVEGMIRLLPGTEIVLAFLSG